MKQAPQITSERQQFGYLDDTVHLECAATSIPRARHISWSFQGREINANGDPEFSILEETTEQGIKSTLIIRNSRTWHFSSYNCSVVNDYGTDVLQIELAFSQTIWRYLTSTANLPIFLTISITSVVILIVLVCFVYLKTMGHKARQVKKEKHFMPHDNYMMNFSDVSGRIRWSRIWMSELLLRAIEWIEWNEGNWILRRQLTEHAISFYTHLLIGNIKYG